MDFHRKNDRTIFMMICDMESLVFCQESFDGKKAVGDARILRKSIDTFDFALMTSCNSTIVSNDLGVLHALLNGGDTTVHKPEDTDEPDYYTPWLISDQMANWYAINWCVIYSRISINRNSSSNCLRNPTAKTCTYKKEQKNCRLISWFSWCQRVLNFYSLLCTYIVKANLKKISIWLKFVKKN